MRRKAVKKHLKAAAGLRSCLAAYRDRLSRDLARRPAVPSEPGFDYQPYFEHMDAELAAAGRALESAEDGYVRDKSSLIGLRRSQRQVASELFDLQSATKRLLGGILPSGLENTLLGGTTPRGAVELARQVRATVMLLHDFDGFPPAPVAGVTFDAPALAAELEAGRRQLEVSIATLIEAEAGVTGSCSLADDAAAEAARVCLWVARCMEGFGHLTGESRLTGRGR